MEKKNKGIFNLDYEETILVLGKYGRLKARLKIVYGLAEKLLTLIIGKNGLGTEEERISREIKEQASVVIDPEDEI